MPDHAKPWIRAVRPAAPVRLICLPYAGGGTADFHRWREYLPGSADLCPVVLAGRESRLSEQAVPAMAPLVEAMLRGLAPVLRMAPYVLYGHSMGAWLAFELVRAARRAGVPLPAHLIVASRRAPELPAPYPDIAALDEPGFVDAVQQRYGAIPSVILDNPQMMALFLPALKADFALLEGYVHQPEPPLGLPITAVWGRQDPMVDEEDVRGWRAHTDGEFAFRALYAGHFLHREAADEVTEVISSALRRAMSGR